MVENSVVKPESMLNLEDLLQCPVCYEIPPGQIFQCNEGHHVCGGCKARLDVCPVCRALFFGTRNYAMEELISNFRKMRKPKSDIQASGSGSSQSSTPGQDSSAEPENNASEEEDDRENNNEEQQPGPPQPCSGLFRCLCCKPGSVRLPSARLLNHLRYFHSPYLLEGHSDNGEYLQAWQFSTTPGKIVTAVRISDMGIFFLTIDITPVTLCAWLSMAATPWVAHEFCYTITICGNDREAIFSDSVWSVRSCEGTLRKRGHCLMLRDQDALAITAPAAISGKLSVRRTPPDQLTAQSTPRAVLRVANRGRVSASEFEPFLQELQNDVARLSRAFATLGREANALVQSEAQLRVRMGNVEPETATDSDDGLTAAPTARPSARPTAAPTTRPTAAPTARPIAAPTAAPTAEPSEPQSNNEGLSRCARKRMRQRMRAALDEPIPPVAPSTTSRGLFPAAQSRQNGSVAQREQTTSAAQSRQNGQAARLTESTPARQTQNVSTTLPGQSTQPRNIPGRRQRLHHPVNTMEHPAAGTTSRQNGTVIFGGFNVESIAPVTPPPVVPSTSNTSQPEPQTANGNRNKKKRRHRR